MIPLVFLASGSSLFLIFLHTLVLPLLFVICV